jgi:hypothetical protein
MCSTVIVAVSVELPPSLERLRVNLRRSYGPEGSMWWNKVSDAFESAVDEAKKMPLPSFEVAPT